MPLYEFFCERCYRTEGVFRRIDARDRQYECIDCGRLMIRKIAKPMLISEIDGYESPTTGKWISSRSQASEDLKRSNCRLLEPGESRDAIKNAAKIRAANTKKVVEEVVNDAAKELGFNVG